MYCPKCGTPKRPVDRFCKHCGMNFNVNTSYIAHESPQQGNHQMTYVEAQVGYATVKPKNKSSKSIISLLFFVGAVVVFLIANYFQSLVNSSMFSIYYEPTGFFRELLCEITFVPGWVITIVLAGIGMVNLLSRNSPKHNWESDSPVPEVSMQSPTYLPTQYTESNIPLQNKQVSNRTYAEQAATAERVVVTERVVAEDRATAEERVAIEERTVAERVAEERAVADRVAAAERVDAEIAVAEDYICDDSEEPIKKTEESEHCEETPLNPPPTIRVKIKKRR